MDNQSPTLEQTVAGKEPAKQEVTAVTGTVEQPKTFLTLAQLERMYILNALKVTNGNKTKASQILGITIKTLYNKLHQYGEFENYATRTKPAADGQ
jgi:DNA-binding NtrC family response regulator